VQAGKVRGGFCAHVLGHWQAPVHDVAARDNNPAPPGVIATLAADEETATRYCLIEEPAVSSRDRRLQRLARDRPGRGVDLQGLRSHAPRYQRHRGAGRLVIYCGAVDAYGVALPGAVDLAGFDFLWALLFLVVDEDEVDWLDAAESMASVLVADDGLMRCAG
jgi:hypothetical protein